MNQVVATPLLREMNRGRHLGQSQILGCLSQFAAVEELTKQSPRQLQRVSFLMQNPKGSDRKDTNDIAFLVFIFQHDECNHEPVHIFLNEDASGDFSGLVTRPKVKTHSSKLGKSNGGKIPVVEFAQKPLRRATNSTTHASTTGCQNSWRKAAFQNTVTYGTFVK